MSWAVRVTKNDEFGGSTVVSQVYKDRPRVQVGDYNTPTVISGSPEETIIYIGPNRYEQIVVEPTEDE